LADKSTSSVSHRFKKLSGRSFKQYQIEYNLAMAISWLKSDLEKTIAEIAARLGYQYPFYFSRLFKKYRGLPPSRVRRYR